VIEALGVGPELGQVVEPARYVGHDHAHAGLEIVALDIAAREAGKNRLALHQGDASMRHPARHGQADDADAGTHVEHPLAAPGLGGSRRRQQYRVDPGAVALLRLQDAQRAAEEGILGDGLLGGAIAQARASPSLMSQASRPAWPSV
jgi:hypothetical protein